MGPERVSVVVTILLAVVLAGVGLVDIAIVALYGKEESITALVHRVSKEYPAIPLAAGMLIGHLFL